MTKPMKLDLRPRGSNEPPGKPLPRITDAERKTVVDHAVRWTLNILVEVLGNHGEHMPVARRDAIKAAVRSLGDAQWLR